MTVLKLIYQLLFGPLELFFETVYGIAYNIVGSTGAAIIPLSLCVNFLLLPLYNRADAMQREESEHEKQMAAGVAHIKKTFKGDERYMMLQAYYRVNHHKPVYALRSSLAILLEIPFFVAAYHFLATYPGLNGAVFGPLKNLAAPDRLLKIGSLPINVLPILMTAINIVSASIYAKDMTRKDKLKLYAMALVFLAVLYFSPSGLVFYWTLNNLFSLVKNVVNSLKGGTRKKVICAVFTAIGAVFIGYALLVYKKHDLNQLLVIVIGLVFIIPLIRAITGAKIKREKPEEAEEPKKKISLFVIACLFMTILLGVLIPSSVIKSSPAEFVVITEYQSPLLYVVSALCLAAGTFMLWFNLFYYLANNKAKRVMEACIWIVAVIAVVNYMFFGTKLGNLSAELKYDIDLSFTARQCLINASVIALAGAAVFILWLKKRKIVAAILPVIVVAVAGMSIYNIAGISTRLPGLKTLVEQQSTEKTTLTLSKTGKNVIVLMLDRSIGAYVPYMMQEDQELKEMFDGFTYYPNTLSYGTRTNTGSPALFGGYEYTPEEMNKRDTEKLADKQNEALKVMPVIFSEAGYDVTVCDPPYAGYTWIPDLSIYDGYESIRASNTENGQFGGSSDVLSMKQKLWMRNFFCYSIMKASPLFLQPGLYQGGMYLNMERMTPLLLSSQIAFGRSTASGMWDSFTNSFSVLKALPEITEIAEDGRDTFLMMNNSTPHYAVLLKEPEYEPASIIDNSSYDAKNESRFTIDGRTLKTSTAYQMSHYQSNMAAFKQLGKWFDYLRQQGVYDNTRIIIVGDHGWPLEQLDDMIFGRQPNRDTKYNPEDAMAYNPLLIVKDFGSTGFTTDDRFMTNADTPTLALEGIIEDPVNPFTGRQINADAKNAKEQHVFYTDFWGTEYNSGNKFLPGRWYALENQNIFDVNNWKPIGEY